MIRLYKMQFFLSNIILCIFKRKLFFNERPLQVMVKDVDFAENVMVNKTDFYIKK